MERRKVPTLSSQERTIVLVGVIAVAMATTFVLAAFFASAGSSRQARSDVPSTTRATSAADTARASRTPTATATSPSRTASRRSTAAGVAPVRRRDRPTVVFRPASSWDDGFVGAVTITNTTAAPLMWELSFELRDAEIDDVWQASLEQSDSGIVVARGLDYNAVVAPGERVEFGFRAEGSARPRVRGCTLNGLSCRLRRG
jgi:cellulase/cellobiase CelA1